MEQKGAYGTNANQRRPFQHNVPQMMTFSDSMPGASRQRTLNPVEKMAEFRENQRRGLEGIGSTHGTHMQIQSPEQRARIDAILNRYQIASASPEQQHKIPRLRELLHQEIQNENYRREKEAEEKKSELQRTAAELNRLHGMLASYDKQFAEAEALNAEREENSQKLRQALAGQLRITAVNENYIIDLQKDHAEREELVQTLERTKRNLESELKFMNERVQLLENDIDKMIEKGHITDNNFYNIMKEGILQWKGLRDTMLSKEPKETFWQTVHAYGTFMEKTLFLSDQAMKMSEDLMIRTEYIWSRQLMDQMGADQGHYLSFTKLMDFQPLPLGDFYQEQSRSDSDSDDSLDDEVSDFKMFHSPDSSPFSQSAEFMSIDKLIDMNPKALSSQSSGDDDDDSDSGYMADMPTIFGSELYQFGNRPTQEPRLSYSTSYSNQQGFQPQNRVPDQAITHRSDRITFPDAVARKIGKKTPGSRFSDSLDDVETSEPLIECLSLGRKRTETSHSPYTRPQMVLKNSIIHKYLRKEGEPHEYRVRRPRIKGKFPDRISKEDRIGSSQSTQRRRGQSLSTISPTLGSLSGEELSKIVTVGASGGSTTASKSTDSVRKSTVGYSLAEWLWIYSKQRPKALIRPLVGVAVCMAVTYIFGDWKRYHSFIMVNDLANDRIMNRMRQAQTELQAVGPYMIKNWKRWLDADRVALQ